MQDQGNRTDDESAAYQSEQSITSGRATADQPDALACTRAFHEATESNFSDVQDEGAMMISGSSLMRLPSQSLPILTSSHPAFEPKHAYSSRSLDENEMRDNPASCGEDASSVTQPCHLSSSSSSSALHRFRVWTAEHMPLKVYDCADNLPHSFSFLTAPIPLPPSVKVEDEAELRNHFNSFPLPVLIHLLYYTSLIPSSNLFSSGLWPNGTGYLQNSSSGGDTPDPHRTLGEVSQGSQSLYSRSARQGNSSMVQPPETKSLIAGFDKDNPMHLAWLKKLWFEHHRVFLLSAEFIATKKTLLDVSPAEESSSATLSATEMRYPTPSKSAHTLLGIYPKSPSSSVSYGKDGVTPCCTHQTQNSISSGEMKYSGTLEILDEYVAKPPLPKDPLTRKLFTVNFPPFELPHSEWVSPIGFQQEDPSTDFRGGGFLSLIILALYIVRCPRDWLADIMEERSSGYCPAVVSLNISFFLEGLCGLQVLNCEHSEPDSPQTDSKTKRKKDLKGTNACASFNASRHSDKKIRFRSKVAQYMVAEYVLRGTLHRQKVDEEEMKKLRGEKPNRRGSKHKHRHKVRKSEKNKKDKITSSMDHLVMCAEEAEVLCGSKRESKHSTSPRNDGLLDGKRYSSVERHSASYLVPPSTGENEETRKSSLSNQTFSSSLTALPNSAFSYRSSGDSSMQERGKEPATDGGAALTTFSASSLPPSSLSDRFRAAVTKDMKEPRNTTDSLLPFQLGSTPELRDGKGCIPNLVEFACASPSGVFSCPLVISEDAESNKTPLDRLVFLHTMYMRRVRAAWQKSPKNLMDFNKLLCKVFKESEKSWLSCKKKHSRSAKKS